MRKTIVLCGGGSGGHIMPLLAVAREIRKIEPKTRLVYVGEKHGKFSHIAPESRLFDECHYISAGKLRRYHNDSMIKKLIDIKTNALNVRDAVRLMQGVVQAKRLFKRLKADSVLLKGGFVCVPASIGAHAAGAYIVTHDSDAIPGLSNKFAAKYAQVHATGMPTKYYNYPNHKMLYTGLPIDERFRPYSISEQRFLREKYKIPLSAEVVLVTGGSQGARRLNEWSRQAVIAQMAKNQRLFAIFVVGKGNKPQVEGKGLTDDVKKRLIVEEYTTELFHYTAISNVVITRAGATTMAELGNQKKACIVVPNPDLTGGHQMKNAVAYQENAACIRVDESQLLKSSKPLESAIAEIIGSNQKQNTLGENLYVMHPNGSHAATILAKLLITRPDSIALESFGS